MRSSASAPEALGALDQLFGELPRLLDGLPRLARRRALGDFVERAVAERDEAVEARDLGRDLAHAGRLQARHPAGEPFELELPRREDGGGALEPRRGLVQRRRQRLGRRCRPASRLLELMEDVVEQDAHRLQPFVELR